MENGTSAPSPEEDDFEEYDVLIVGNLSDHEDAEPCAHYDGRPLSAQLVPRLYSTLFAAGLLSNVVVVLVLVKHKGLRQVENIYFLNVALSNLCFLLSLPLWAHAASHGGVPGEPACRFLEGLSALGLCGEALGCVLLAMHRCLAFSAGRRLSWAASSVPCGVTVSLLAWVMVTLFTLPELMSPTPQRDGWAARCSAISPLFLPAEEPFWKDFLTLKTNVLGFLLPLLALLALLACSEGLSSRDRGHDLDRLALAMLAVFLLMWGPYNVTLFLWTFEEHFSLQDCQTAYALDRAVHVTKIIADVHCCANPLLYVLLDRAFRGHLGRLCPVCGRAPPSRTRDPPRGEYGHCTGV